MEATTDAAPKPRRRAVRTGFEPLWRAYRRRPNALRRNQLVEAYQHLVTSVVRRFAARLPRTVDRGDLSTAANVGLMGAVASFDPKRGVGFEAYAEMRIRGALLDELRTEDWLPRPWRQRIEMQKRVVEELRTGLGREPHDEEIAQHMDLSLGEYELLFGTGLPGAATGTMRPDAGDEHGSGLDVVADTRNDAPGEKLTRDELLRLVAQRLTALEYRIVYLKYWEELPMREIGQVTNLSESRVCKIHARLIDRLRDRFRVGAE